MAALYHVEYRIQVLERLLGLEAFRQNGPVVQNKSLVTTTPPGLVNIGNTCFINSILQALSSLGCIVPFLNELGQVSRQLANVLSALQKPGVKCYNPLELITALVPSQKMYSYLYEQQDADEFYQLISSAIDVEMAQKRLESTGLGMGEKLKLEADPFLGLTCYTVVCTVCNYADGIVYQRTKSLTLQVSSQASNLYQLLAGHFQDDVMTNVQCKMCSAKKRLETGGSSFITTAIKEAIKDENLDSINTNPVYSTKLKQSAIVTTPSVLVLYLNRLSMDKYNNLFKVYRHIECPMILDIAELLQYKGILSIHDKQGISTRYQLKSLVVHQGTHAGGHYICYRLFAGNTWWRISDRDTKRCSEEVVLAQGGATLALYERL